MCRQTIYQFSCHHYLRYRPVMCRYRFLLLHAIKPELHVFDEECPECTSITKEEVKGKGRASGKKKRRPPSPDPSILEELYDEDGGEVGDTSKYWPPKVRKRMGLR